MSLGDTLAKEKFAPSSIYHRIVDHDAPITFMKSIAYADFTRFVFLSSKVSPKDIVLVLLGDDRYFIFKC